MSGTDRLTGEALERDDTGRVTCDYEPTALEVSVARDAICREFGNNGTDGYYIRIVRAVIAAHRRASQAAPAPVAWFWERGGDLELTLLKDGRYGKRLTKVGFTAHPLYRAPAPSDGLREAVETIVNTHGFLTDLGYILGKQNGNYRRAWASAVVRREMVKLAQQYADDGIQALTPSPAQEGGE